MVVDAASVTDRVPFFACINLYEREDRYKMMKAEFERAGIASRVHWHRTRRHPQKGRVGCFESHLAVYRATVEAHAPYAVVFEDDVRLAPHWSKSLSRFLDLVDSGMHWCYASLQNSGGEVPLTRPGDVEALPRGVRRAAFYFLRCYAISREAMERALRQGVTTAHADVALAVANWGDGFLVRPAVALDVPSKSDNDWAEGGLGPWLAGQMQGVTHFPCFFADRWKIHVMPALRSQDKLEAETWSKFMKEAGANEHLDVGHGPSAEANAAAKAAANRRGYFPCYALKAEAPQAATPAGAAGI